MVMKPDSGFTHFLLYGNAFALGFVLMGFEMLGSRYLYPYYGGSIETWAALISTVLAALMIGYFVGGILADRFPSLSLLAILVFLSSGFFLMVPKSADPLLAWTIEAFGDGVWSVLLASMALLLIPISLLGAFIPFAVRLALMEQGKSGHVSGLIYGISTMGNILGTLITTFYLIPSIGTRSITYLLALLAGASGFSLWLCSQKKFISK